mmetsp:Transcript_16343/g.38848  ORF Transcript_16343/g.38848 Transcript_16343/m.38848 type:complete len:307 (+) Transcript_16343:571-1491(+)
MDLSIPAGRGRAPPREDGCCDCKEEEDHGDIAKLALLGRLLSDAHDVSHHEQQKVHWRGAQCKHKDAEAGPWEATRQPRGRQIRVREVVKRLLRLQTPHLAALPHCRPVFSQQKQRRKRADQHADEIGRVEPAVVQLGGKHEHDIAYDATEEEQRALHRAGHGILRGGHHLGCKCLNSNVVHALAEAPNEDASHEPVEVVSQVRHQANENARGGSEHPGSKEDTPAKAMGAEDHKVTEEAHQRVQQHRASVDELCEAHESSLILVPEVLALPRQEVGEPRRRVEAGVEPVGHQAGNATHRPRGALR